MEAHKANYILYVHSIFIEIKIKLYRCTYVNEFMYIYIVDIGIISSESVKIHIPVYIYNIYICICVYYRCNRLVVLSHCPPVNGCRESCTYIFSYTYVLHIHYTYMNI